MTDDATPMLGRYVPPDEYGRLETFEVFQPTEIEFHCPELQALCPAVDGIQPDIYEAKISYTALDRAIESKSLKLWLVTYRERRIFAEHLAAEMTETLAQVEGIVDIEVELRQNMRGGIVTVVRCAQ